MARVDACCKWLLNDHIELNDTSSRSMIVVTQEIGVGAVE